MMRFLIVVTFIPLLWLLVPSIGYDSQQFMKNYPTPFTESNRVLGMILAFNHYHIDPLLLLLNEYVSMCEAGWSPTIVLFTTVHWTEILLRYFRQKCYCYRIQKSIEIRVKEFPPSISTALAAQHRPYIAEELNNFDVFIYHEDDIWFTTHHLSGFLSETKRLHQLLPEKGLLENCIGFQRYRRIFQGNNIHTAPRDVDIVENELLEEMPTFNPICLQDQPYLLVTGNIHQGMWALTQQQIRMLQEKCQFLNQSSPSREFMSSFSLFEHKPYHCGMNKLLPADRLVSFSILHYFQQRHISWTPVFLADENIRAGYNYVARQAVTTPDCWKTIVEAAKAEQAKFPVPGH